MGSSVDEVEEDEGIENNALRHYNFLSYDVNGTMSGFPSPDPSVTTNRAFMDWMMRGEMAYEVRHAGAA